jgi:hypothetical protein
MIGVIMSQDLEQAVKVFLAAEENKKWRESYLKEFNRNLELSSALTDMFCCFRCLTTEGGWDTMDEKMKAKMIEYRNNARAIWLGRPLTDEEKKEMP